MAIKKQGRKQIDLPEVTTAQRSAEKGRIQFNVTTGLAEYYDGNQWKPIDSPPVISSINPTSILESGLSSNQTIVITGSNFSSTVTAKIIGNDGTEITPASTTRNSNTQVTITTPTSGMTAANEPYDIQITNNSGLSGTLADALSINDGPVFTTAAGTLGTLAHDARAVSNLTTSTIAATDEESDTVTFAVTSGALPSGVTLGSNGALSGTAAEGAATYNFTVTATSTGGTADRAFAITVSAPPFITATGGTETDDGDFRVHTFTSSGTFQVTSLGTDSTHGSKVEYLVVGGGAGGGAGSHGGGGGAGGYRHNSAYDFTVSEQSYSITVGAYGGTRTTGGVSTFSNISSAGGGRGGHNNSENGQAGGSGGGGAGHFNSGSGGSGNTPSVSPSQGNSGGSGQDGTPAYGAGGGGGAGQGGQNGSRNSGGGTGGNGSSNDIHGSSRTYSAGGGGHGHSSPAAGGSSNLGGSQSPNAASGRNTANNYGAGGAGDNDDASSGVVIIRYKFQ